MRFLLCLLVGLAPAAVRATRPDQEGAWQLKGLSAGEHLALALDHVENDAWQDPEYLESLRERRRR